MTSYNYDTDYVEVGDYIIVYGCHQAMPWDSSGELLEIMSVSAKNRATFEILNQFPLPIDYGKKCGSFHHSHWSDRRKIYYPLKGNEPRYWKKLTNEELEKIRQENLAVYERTAEKRHQFLGTLTFCSLDGEVLHNPYSDQK